VPFYGEQYDVYEEARRTHRRPVSVKAACVPSSHVGCGGVWRQRAGGREAPLSSPHTWLGSGAGSACARGRAGQRFRSVHGKPASQKEARGAGLAGRGGEGHCVVCSKRRCRPLNQPRLPGTAARSGQLPGQDDACVPVACEKSPLQPAAAHRCRQQRKVNTHFLDQVVEPCNTYKHVHVHDAMKPRCPHTVRTRQTDLQSLSAGHRVAPLRRPS